MPAGPTLSRRTVLTGLAGAAGLTVVTGCDGAEVLRPATTQSPEPDPDQALVDRVVGEQTAAWRLAAGARLTGLAAMHRAHVEALDGEVTGRPLRRQVTVEEVRRREQRLHATLVEAALAADSGQLARLLASMSAAVSQRVVVL